MLVFTLLNSILIFLLISFFGRFLGNSGVKITVTISVFLNFILVCVCLGCKPIVAIDPTLVSFGA